MPGYEGEAPPGDIPHGQLQEFFPAVTKQLAAGRIAVHVPAAVVHQENRLEGVLEDGLEATPGLLEHLLDAPAIGDILCQGDGAGKAALRIRERGVEPLAEDSAAVLGAVLVDAVGLHVPGLKPRSTSCRDSSSGSSTTSPRKSRPRTSSRV